MKYKATLDSLSKTITSGVFILFIFIGQKNLNGIIKADGDSVSVVIHGDILLLLPVILIFSYLFSSRSYTLTNNELIINRPIGNRVINIADISEIKIPDASDFSGTIRTFGNGGIFGYYGKYYNSKLGNMTWYVTQKLNRILILTKQGDKIIISPDDFGLVDKVQMTRKNDE